VKQGDRVRFLDASAVTEAVASMCIEACTRPSPGLRAALEKAVADSPSGPGRSALGLCLKNLDEAASTGLPMCQDTGIAVVFAERGNRLVIEGCSLREAVDLGVEKGYREGRLRNSLVCDALNRTPLPVNSPSVLHLSEIQGDSLTLDLLVKGAGSENASASAMLPPLSGEDEITGFVRDVVLAKAAGACPPLFLGVGLGGNLEACGVLAKRALLRPFGTPGETPAQKHLEERILAAVNDTGIGPQGFGGPVTALEVRVELAPCHMASLPVSVCIECHAHRTARRVL
jgi:fumarate hydratase subunit alpha